MTADAEQGRSTEERGRTTASATPDEGVGAVLSRMARSLQELPDLAQTLQGVVDAAVANIRGADFAGITQIVDGIPRTTAGTDPLVGAVDEVQYETGQGPCLSAIADQATVSSADLATETRWPDFAQRTVDLGIRSMLAFQLFVRSKDVGALNLYSRAPGAFDAVDEQMGLLLASHAAVALVGAQELGDLQAALVTRDVIGQAKGMLMERFSLSGPAAFQLLVAASQATNRKLRDIAVSIAQEGPGQVGRIPTGGAPGLVEQAREADRSAPVRPAAGRAGEVRKPGPPRR
ncbi:GAF and ANTAR domain-containing protein [Nakamurella flavida]|uniref:GAF and ANTAR domain-containing protein n=1 Tax=Nakamurella flavida TaxID=363630 RepID=A0A939C5W9_9ACTN|nr:GAF and ANTAR domain-containing protein [Nakamurella flavida]MBM9477374.1 GAF and ANTAR domain-containing protein [Nakamurella flavida]MDP9777306.1 GAF domain-containing protein [Nakamurella flavida]